jgi:Tat protein secretion system quality control protein TatD with DNase activity
MSSRIRMIDIGANLCDSVYRGIYHGGKQVHGNDLENILKRSQGIGIEKIIITSGYKDELNESLSLIHSYPSFPLYTTVGVHPTRCNEMEGDCDGYIKELISIVKENNKQKVHQLFIFISKYFIGNLILLLFINSPFYFLSMLSFFFLLQMKHIVMM